jgi:hypothetical protein
MKKIPYPGSEKAIKKGCLCPVIDNDFGWGCGQNDATGQPLFWVNDECPIHGGKDERKV